MAITRSALVAKAAEWLGMRERTGANDIWFSDDWGITGHDWCAAYVQSCFYYAGAPLPHQSMYVPYFVQWARDHGENIEVEPRDPATSIQARGIQPGDVVMFTWSLSAWPRWKPDTGHHVGLVESWDGGDVITTIEGNVYPPGGGGYQGVFRRTRSISTSAVINFWRPPVFTDSPLTLAEDDMFSDTDRAELKGAVQAVGELRNLLVETHARTNVLWENIGRQWEVQDRMGVIWPLIVDIHRDRLPKIEDAVARIEAAHQGGHTQTPGTPQEPSGPSLPPVSRPDDLELRVASLERRLDEILSLLKPAA